MATLDDKILGEKLHYYCSSSSEDEGNDSGDSGDEEKDAKISEPSASRSSQSVEYSEWDGTSSNTGPKGVIKDWQRFKQIETEKGEEKEREKLELIKKLSLTCRSALDEDREKSEEADPDLLELMSDDFLVEYQKQRMKEMMARAERLRFGRVFTLENADRFLDAVDEEHDSVTVVVHIYEKDKPGCAAMNGCLGVLAQEYPCAKFCKILGSAAGLSKHFKKEGVPALLVYKKGEVIGNFVRITDHLGTDFYASDVESFLTEHGMLNDKSCVPPIIVQNQNQDSDSD